MDSSDYINGVKNLQRHGHELMDHTPEHRTSYFSTKFNPTSYVSLSGVDHINNTKICLKYSNKINVKKAKRTGYVDIDGSYIISNSNDFNNFGANDCYLYFPDLPSSKIVIIKKIITSDSLIIVDAWNDEINLGKYNNVKYYNLNANHIHISTKALNVLANETQKLAVFFNIEKPVAWIQPGISKNYFFPYLYRNELKESYGANFNYVSGSVYSYSDEKTYKVFNEYNPNNDKQYGMQWGDFNIDSESLQKNKTIIADGIAKHHILIGSSHFTNLLGGWNDYLERVDSILSWCTRNNIPVRTYKDWTNILYNRTPNPEENIFPALNIDLDENQMPDGYNNKSKVSGTWITCKGTWIKDDGVAESNNCSFTISKTGYICNVGRIYPWESDGLGGIEKGENEFEIWTKGATGNFIEVDFQIGKNHSIYKFSAESPEWTKYNLAQSLNGNTILNIPDKISLIDITIRCSDYSSGKVKISGMKLYKKNNTENLSITPQSINVSSDSGRVNLSITSNVAWTLNNTADWITLSSTTGNNNKIITASFKHNIDSLSRSAIITVSSIKLSEKMSIIQNGLAVYKIITEQEPHGTCTLLGERNYLEGTQATITCIPHIGWKFDSWRENDTIITIDSIYSFKVEQSHNFVAKLSQLTNIKNQDSQILQKYELFQNYPNPFNPTTQIRFAIPQKNNVVVEIFDLVGEKIEILLNKNLSSGFYNVIFNASNLPAGYIFAA